MNLPADLLTLARYLVRHEPRRPRQATLRRAVSTAYYALFHLLTSEGVRYLVSGGDVSVLRHATERAFDHGTMRQVVRAFAAGNLPGAIAPLFPLGLSEELRLVARIFNQMQEARHSADYDSMQRLTRQDTSSLINDVATAFQAWRTIRRQPEAKVFLVSLLLWRQWNR